VILMLELRNIDVYYGMVQVLTDVSITIGDGESVGLFGPNGHGKSTILKAISGLVKLAKGSITLDGKRIDNLPPERIAKMGVTQVPEGQRLFPEMSVKENLLLGASTKDAWKSREEGIKRVFKIFPELYERRNHKCSTLSGGQRQMVAIGRGLMPSSKVLLLDEPTLGLSPVLTEKILEKIREIKESEQRSIIIIEENLSNVTEIADRLYLIENGSVALSGKTEEIIGNDYIKQAYLGKL